MPTAPPKQQAAAIPINGIYCTAACTTWPVLPISVNIVSLQSLVNVPGNTRNPASRIQVEKEAQIVCNLGDSIHAVIISYKHAFGDWSFVVFINIRRPCYYKASVRFKGLGRGRKELLIEKLQV